MDAIINTSDNTRNLVEEVLKQNPHICLDVTSVLVVALDKSGVVVLINKKGAEILGYAQSEIVGKNWFDYFIAPENEKEIRQAFSDIFEGKSNLVEYYEHMIVTRNGEKRLVSFHNALIKDADGAIIGIISSGEDLTVQKQLSKSLSKQERFSEVVADNLPIGYCINTISDGKVVFMNKKFEEIYGWSRTVLTDVDAYFNTVYPDPEFRKKLKEQVMMDIMSANPARMIWKNLLIVRQSGEHAYITAQNIPLYEYDLMVSTVIDVSREVASEKALRAEQRLQQAILENSPDLAWVKDKEGVVLMVNKSFADALHKSPERIIGKTDYDLWDDRALADAYRADDAEVMASGKKIKKQEYMTVPGSDIKVFVETIKSPIYNEDGTIFGTTGIARVIDPPIGE